MFCPGRLAASATNDQPCVLSGHWLCAGTRGVRGLRGAGAGRDGGEDRRQRHALRISRPAAARQIARAASIAASWPWGEQPQDKRWPTAADAVPDGPIQWSEREAAPDATPRGARHRLLSSREHRTAGSAAAGSAAAGTAAGGAAAGGAAAAGTRVDHGQ